MPGDANHEPEYVAARHALLNALEALGQHRDAVVLVKATRSYRFLFKALSGARAMMKSRRMSNGSLEQLPQ